MTARLHAVEDGPTDGRVLVLGPSLGTDLGLFDAQVAALGDTLRVIRFDLRGHGGSEVLPGPCTMADLAADVLALLDRLGVQRFSYAGVSIGGAIGQQLALTVPDRLERLAVIASAARFADPPSWAVRAQQVREAGTGSLVPSRTGTWFTAAWAERHPEQAERLLAVLRATPPEGYAACCEAIGAFDVHGRLGHITRPTLAIAGAEDPATTVDMVRHVADDISGAQLLVVPGPPTCRMRPTRTRWMPRCANTSADGREHSCPRSLSTHRRRSRPSGRTAADLASRLRGRR